MSGDDLAFRDADPSEDDEMARIMYNAFLPIWNHNWFQCLTAPLQPIPSTFSPLTILQSRRLSFYRSWLSLNRVHNGDITVAHTPSSSQIAAIVLLLPPHARPSWSQLSIAYQTGFLQALFGLSGLKGVYRMAFTFEANVHRLLAEGLRGLEMGNVKEDEIVLVQGCVRNPEWEGRGPARRLLDWSIRRRWEREKNLVAAGKVSGLTPVYLDTTLAYAARVYEEIGFRVVGSCKLPTGADEEGIKLKKGVKRKAATDKQYVMFRMPDT